jgi:hypothetical protein
MAGAGGSRIPAMSELDVEMRRHAEQAVASSSRLLEKPLDYSVPTASAVDRLLEGMALAAKIAPDGAAGLDRVALSYGAYVGEVIRTNGSGLWLKDVPGVLPGQVSLCVGKEHVYPLGAVAGFLRGNPTVLDGVEVRSVESYVARVLASQDAWLKGLVLSGAPDFAQLQAAMSDDQALSAFLVNICGETVMTAALKWGVMLDFTEASLADVEEVLGVLHDGLKSASHGGQPAPDKVRGMAIRFGVYVGEVVRRSMGGRWTNAEVAGQGAVLRLVIGSAECYPLRKVEKRLTEGPGDDVRFYVRAMKQVLARTAG